MSARHLEQGHFVGGQASPLRRTQSSTRWKQSASGERPSTVPPPPFTRETDVGGIEWWLEAHMSIVAAMRCTEQTVATMPSGARGATRCVRVPPSALADARDALYALYCDAADPRMAPLVCDGAPLAEYVRALYAWIEDLIETIAPSLRDPHAGYERATSRLLVREARFCAVTARLAPILEGAIDALAIDAGSPVEPLRALAFDLKDMLRAAAQLRVTGG